MSERTGDFVVRSPPASRLRRNYFVRTQGGLSILASPMPHHDQDGRISCSVVDTFLALLLRSGGDSVEKVGEAAGVALGIAENAATGGADRPVEGMSFTVIVHDSLNPMVFNLGSNSVLRLADQTASDVLEPHGTLPWGTKVALPGSDCSKEIRSAVAVSLSAGQSILAAPPSSVIRPFAHGGAQEEALDEVLRALARPYRQFPDAYLQVVRSA